MAEAMIAVKTADGGDMPAYVALPARPNGAAVVILQEIFGVNANIRAIADHYASSGTLAIAPDLFWRLQPGVDLDPSDPASRDVAMPLMEQLDQPQAVRDALAAAAYVRALPRWTGGVGAVGYCLGGKLAYLLSMQPGIDAAVSYYGTGIHGALDQADRIRCPMLLHVATEDNLCPRPGQAALHAQFDRSTLVTILDYAGAGHAFARRGAATFIADAAARADAATAAFFAKHLGAAMTEPE